MPEAQNPFDLPIYEIKEVLADPAIKAVIQAMRRDVFRYLGIDDGKSDAVMAECLHFARSCLNVTEYERLSHAALAREGITRVIPEKLVERAHIIHAQIQPHLLAGSILDLGCGDARLAQQLAQDGFTLQLADIYKNSNVASTGMPFQLLGQSESIPFGDNQFDNTLLLTVLHHSDDPVKVIREAWRVTRPKGRVIVIESVYGVHERSPIRCQREQEYPALTDEQQRKVNIFFDHFYNRIIHYADDSTQKVNLPFKFNTPNGWEHLFEQAGFNQERMIRLGVDQPTVPEYHTLHVLTAIK